MSFSGGKRPFYLSSAVVFLIISLVHICVISSQTRTTAVAIRIFPRSLVAEEEDQGQLMMEQPAPPPPPPSPAKNQTEIFKENFNSRLSDLNSTTNVTFVDYKRSIPSCPDPLHN